MGDVIDGQVESRFLARVAQQRAHQWCEIAQVQQSRVNGFCQENSAIVAKCSWHVGCFMRSSSYGGSHNEKELVDVGGAWFVSDSYGMRF
jgi:hypothetical protein